MATEQEPALRRPAAAPRAAELAASSAEQDADRLSMSTLSFQDYVRKRMLKRRQASREAASARHSGAGRSAAAVPTPAAEPDRHPHRHAPRRRRALRVGDRRAAGRGEHRAGRDRAVRGAEPVRSLADSPDVGFDAAEALRRDGDLLSELRAVKGLIEERFGALAFMEKLQRRPAEARLAQKLLDCGFSPMLVRKMADGLDADAGDETEWAAQVLEKNLRTAAAARVDRGPRRRVRADRRHRRRQDDDDGQDRRRLRRPPRRRPTSA